MLGGKIFLLKIYRHVHQTYENRHFHQRADYGGKGLTGIYAEYRYSDCDCQFKVIARSGKRESSRLFISGVKSSPHIERDEEHQQKVDEQRDGHLYYI